jgi:hypothetical protein
MKQSPKAAVTIVMAALLLGCGPAAKEKKVIEELTSKMKTVCVGRFVMDVPEDVKIDGRVKLFYGLDVKSALLTCRRKRVPATASGRS